MARLPKTAYNYGSKGAGKSGSKPGGKSGSKPGGKSAPAKSGPDPFGLGTQYGIVGPNPIIPKPSGKGHFPVRPDPRNPGGKPATPPKSGKAATPPKSGKPPKPAPPTRIPVSPFLTPAQQKVLNDYDTTYGYNVGALQRRVGDAGANTNQALATAAKTHDVNADNADQSLAARGLFQSSIRDSDLNDIDATLATRNNTLNTNLNRLTLDTNARIARLGTDWANTHNYYNSLAVANAAAQPPADAPAPGTTPPGGPNGPNGTTLPSGGVGLLPGVTPIRQNPPGARNDPGRTPTRQPDKPAGGKQTFAPPSQRRPSGGAGLGPAVNPGGGRRH